MKKVILFFACCMFLTPIIRAEELNPKAVCQMLERIGGEGAADRFVIILDEALSSKGGNGEVFSISVQDGKPCIKGSTLSAITTGVGWYLNHYAHINLAWNRLTIEDLAARTLPLPEQEEIRTCHADYRYYLNYCTFSYSMSVWTWERWQQEIDWMALHGINMPLQIVGLDVVWMRLLTEYYGYTEAEASAFIAGPCFQAWWGMNNLEGWGGPNPSWWYERQAKLAKNITDRMRDLGMQPVLPGFSGMVPSNFTAKTGHAANQQGNWCGFKRPYILNPNNAAFASMAANYYKVLKEVMGTSVYYSMDPFHEGANTNGIDVPAAYAAIAKAMFAANDDIDEKWVIQYWQWSGAQYNVLNKVAKGSLVVLDLFSTAHTHFGEYKGHDAVYCMLTNFGGRTGLMGRFNGVIDGYFEQKAKYANIKGVGATPEAIESVPVVYDILFELPWYDSKPDAATWMENYTLSRYGESNALAKMAWEKLRNSALNCQSTLQGPHEAVVCARPALTVDKVSSWGGTNIFYDAQYVVDAARRLLDAGLSGDNYSYDLTDVARQALTDYAYYLLKSINEAHSAGDTEAFNSRRDAFLQLINSLDQLLNTNKNFMLGNWTQMARDIASEVSGTTESDRKWLELNNARTLISTWGEEVNANSGGLRDYSYREWAGMLKDYYLPRWEYFFENNLKAPSGGWYKMERAWALNDKLSYSNVPTGNTADVLKTIWDKVFLDFALQGGDNYYIYRAMRTDKTAEICGMAARGANYVAPVKIAKGEEATLAVDFNNDGTFEASEKAMVQSETGLLSIDIPETAVAGKVKASIMLPDGTNFLYMLMLQDNIDEPRTVSVKTANAAEGSVEIVGSKETSVTNTDFVTVKAHPVDGFNFFNWTDAEGNAVSSENPYTYCGKAAIDLVAHFVPNKWGTPEEDKADWGDITSYKQYVSTISLTQNGQSTNLYEATACPEQLFNLVPKQVEVAPGAEFSISWKDAGGLQYTYLSAYLDLNADGEFDMGDELLGVKGTLSAQNTAVKSGTFTILLPYDMPLGLTHIRLRFDGAWKSGYKTTEKGKAFPAKMTANRMVYDIPVNVVAVAPYATTVTVKSVDELLGTVDANGQPATHVYTKTDEVVLRATPSDGQRLLCWKDGHGRVLPKEWMEENVVRFKPYDNAVITAYFEPTAALVYGDWEFLYEKTAAGGLRITEVKKEGGSSLQLNTANNLNLPLEKIKYGALHNLSLLESIQLPATLQAFEPLLNETSFEGNGVSNAQVSLASPLEVDGAWTLTLQVESNGSSFNEWGSALLATGTEALAERYSGGFQLYLTKAGKIVAKVNCGEEGKFETQATMGRRFQVELAYDGAKQSLVLTFQPEEGAAEQKEYNGVTLSAATSLCAALPEGIDVALSVASASSPIAPFLGCAALSQLSFPEGNSVYSVSDNVLHTADGSTLLAYPEGLSAHVYALPERVTHIASQAFTAAPYLHLLRPESTTPATCDANAFSKCQLYVQAPKGSESSYSAAWGLPLFWSLPATAQNTNLRSIGKKDKIEFCATDESTATAIVQGYSNPVCYTRTFEAGRYYPIYFPSMVTSICVEGFPQGEVTLKDFYIYRFDETRAEFVRATPTGGPYMLAVPASIAGHAVTFSFFGLGGAYFTGFNGNGTAQIAKSSVRPYSYDAVTNEWRLDSSADFSLWPFEAAIFPADGFPNIIAGPDNANAIENLPMLDSEIRRSYDLQGRPYAPNSRGVRIDADGSKHLKP